MLSHGDQLSSLETRKRLISLHVLGVALIGGVIMFALFAWLEAPAGSVHGNAIMILRFAWGGLALSELPVMFILRQAMLGRAALLHRNAPHLPASKPIDEAVFMIFRAWSILALAIPESLALFGCVIMLLSGEALDGVLIAAPVIAMLAVFPTGDRWRAFEHHARERAANAP
jgi:hypothetical protein